MRSSEGKTAASRREGAELLRAFAGEEKVACGIPGPDPRGGTIGTAGTTPMMEVKFPQTEA